MTMGAGVQMPSGAWFAGRYERQRLLGSGSTGEVWYADDHLLDRPVAIKQLLGDNPDPEVVERIAREARLTARLSHPNAVSIYDLIVLENRPHLVMEYVPGRSLAEILEVERDLTPRAAAPILAQIASALAAAHRLGIVHRDVKPANILITPDGTAKLVDFGIARAADVRGLTQAGHIVGSLSYLSPEVALGAVASPAADVWALGATLYRVVEGRRLFEADSTLALMAGLLRAPLPVPRHAGVLTNLLVAMLERDPVCRPSAAVVAAELAAVPAVPPPARSTQLSPLAEQPAPPPPPTGLAHPGRTAGPPTGPLPFATQALSRPPGRTRRRRWAGWIAVLAGLALIGGLAVVGLTRGGSHPVVPSTRSIPVGTSSRTNSSAPGAPANGACVTFSTQIEWSWAAASAGVLTASYRYRLDDGEITPSTTASTTAVLPADGRSHTLDVFSVSGDGTPSTDPLQIRCAAARIERRGTAVDAAGDAGGAGRADITAVAWYWGSNGLEVDITFAVGTPVGRAAVQLFLDDDQAASTGYPGIDCAHVDRARVGVEYAISATATQLIGGGVESNCRLGTVTEKATVRPAGQSLRIVVPRKEFVFESGPSNVKITSAIAAGAPTATLLAFQDVIPDVGRAAISMYNDP